MSNKYDVLDEMVWDFVEEIECGDITFDELDEAYAESFNEDERYILDKSLAYLKSNWDSKDILTKFFMHALNRIDEARREYEEAA